ncbi:MAG: hypothetical protein KIT09_13860 [Bryobacteraceae bacterium]|nr:hypothetical protein [Bryobacteraceae bacterium]
MWPRTVEVMLGFWLVASPFIFRHEVPAYWWNDLMAGFVVIVSSLSSHSHKLRGARLVTAAAGAWVLAFGFVSPRPPPAALQNDIVVGLLLLMFAIIPNNASLPPEGWRNPRPPA